MSQDFKCFKFSKLLMIQKSNEFMLVDVIMILQITFRCDHDIAHTVTFILKKLSSHEPVIFLTVLGHYLP